MKANATRAQKLLFENEQYEPKLQFENKIEEIEKD